MALSLSLHCPLTLSTLPIPPARLGSQQLLHPVDRGRQRRDALVQRSHGDLQEIPEALQLRQTILLLLRLHPELRHKPRRNGDCEQGLLSVTARARRQRWARMLHSSQWFLAKTDRIGAGAHRQGATYHPLSAADGPRLRVRVPHLARSNLALQCREEGVTQGRPAPRHLPLHVLRVRLEQIVDELERVAFGRHPRLATLRHRAVLLDRLRLHFRAVLGVLRGRRGGGWRGRARQSSGVGVTGRPRARRAPESERRLAT